MPPLIDFHSHFLPALDDGCADIAQTREVLSDSLSQGVCRMVATPHFYPVWEDPDSFLSRRARALERAEEAGIPDGKTPSLLHFGAEVAFFSGIGKCAEIEKLCISGTRAVLIEMPFEKWTDRMIRELCDLRDRFELRIVLAHVNRYLGWQSRGFLPLLKKEGFLLQWNAEAFLSFGMRGTALRALRSGFVDILGSDAHDPARRPPLLGKAAAVIEKKLDSRYLQDIFDTSESLLSTAEKL